MDEVWNIFFFSLLLLVSACLTLCTRVLPSNKSVLFVLSSMGTPSPPPTPLQRNNVLEGKPNQCARESMESIVSSFLT